MFFPVQSSLWSLSSKMQSQLLLAWLGSSHSPPSLSPSWRYCVDDRHPYRSPSFTHPRKPQESTHERNSNFKTLYLYIRWMYFNSWISKRSFQDLSCALHSCMIQFVSQTERIWTLWNTKVLFVKFETEVLLTYIQIYTKIPKYQVAACRHLLWRHYTLVLQILSILVQRHTVQIETDGLGKVVENCLSTLASSHISTTMRHVKSLC